jgi:hypothetical protein
MRLPGDGTRYMWTDPAGTGDTGGRNWFALWGLVDVWNRLWMYREWPCEHVHVSGLGLPGPWAMPGQNKQHAHGGVPGSGCMSFGFGLKDYKAEFARLEGWEDAQSDLPVEDWDPMNGAREMIYMRYMDRRFGNTPHQQKEGNTTLQDNMADLGMRFELITGHASQDGRSAIDHGIDLINDALAYDPKFEDWIKAGCPSVKDGGLDVQQQVQLGPKLFVSADCTNLWFALTAYTSMGGHKEATKDPIDTLRYALHSRPVYIEDFRMVNSYGRRASRINDEDTGRKAKRFGNG